MLDSKENKLIYHERKGNLIVFGLIILKKNRDWTKNRILKLIS